MKIQFLGAAGTVTGSKHLVDSGGTRLLVDCGLFQGLKVFRERNWRPPPVDPSSIDAVLLTHAHIDHSGFLPVLVREGFRGKICLTEASRDLAEILLEDSAKLQEEEARFANEEGYSKHDPAEPLYTVEDARRVFEHWQVVPFDTPVTVGEVEARWQLAGHILGAASIRITDGQSTVLFSGDIGRDDDPLMFAPAPAGPADHVVCESTYGDREHPEGDPTVALATAVERSVSRGGKVLISAFAVGRAQLILYHLHRAFELGLAPRVPVFLDSPMATDVTELYSRHPELHRLTRDDCERVFHIADFLRSRDDSKTLNARREPMVIVSASGMLTGGRILHHLRRLVRYPEHTIVLPGFQAPGTRGARLAAGAKSVKIHGDRYAVKAHVVPLDQFSAHADRAGLLEWLGTVDPKPRGVHLVHGEPDAADQFRVSVSERFDVPVHVAEEGQTVDTEASPAR